MNATMNLEKKHFPVLLNDLVKIISPLYGGTFIDCTFGQGGYSNKILENKSNKIIALDRDKDTKKIAKKFKKKYGKRFIFHNSKFSNIKLIKSRDIKGVIFDLGYSLNQIKDTKKGLSFNSQGKLNMKLGLNDFSCHEVINNLDQKDLFLILKFFGEEKQAKIIARRIINFRKKKIIETQDLISIINSVKKFNKKKINNSTQVFQALRIFVNNEISELIKGLIGAYNILPIGGLIAVVSFHSIEDKIIKYFFNYYSKIFNNSRYLPQKDENNKYFTIINKKPIIPSVSELKVNPSSRSAKLRCAIKTRNGCDFVEFYNKFKYLTSVEELKLKL